MKNSLLIFCLFVPVFCSAQVIDSFSDGNFTENPVWVGMQTQFKVNTAFQLQSAATAASTSWLFTASEAIENAVWECSFLIDYSTSSSNFACMYLTADKPDIASLNGYYVMVGGTADEVSLYLQQGTTKTKLIDGTDKRTDGKKVNIRVLVTRDSLGLFQLYSKTDAELEFYREGEARDLNLQSSAWFGLSYTNTASTGLLYCFDDVEVTGRPVSNPALPLQPGELCFNELMVDAPDSATEYIELYNRSEKRLDLSNRSIAVRRADGSLSTVAVFPAGTTLPEKQYIAFTPDTALLQNYFQLPVNAKLMQVKWSNLNNEEARLVLTDADRTTVLDSVQYSSTWHHVLIHDPKGVALEKMHPDLPSNDWSVWHSAASSVNFGTPGYQNSQFRIPGESSGEIIALAQEWFSPDNDGLNDRCIIRYTMPEPGYLLRLTIFTSDGAIWFEPQLPELLSTEGEVYWDGQNRQGRISLPGIYILLAELYHPESGLTKRYKMPVLLTIR